MCTPSDDIVFQHYGNREAVPVELITEMGFDNLCFEAGELSKITEWEDEDFSGARPAAGWKYIDLVIPTADLMHVFPPSDLF